MSVPLRTRVLPADRATIKDMARCLQAGGLVAFPTETVYGLGADATNGRAIARLYEAKGRPTFNPLIVHVTDLAAAQKVAHFDANAVQLAQRFWPGPLTLVLRKSKDCPIAPLATAGLDTVAVRVPDHAVAQDLLAMFGGPVVAPSANRSGHISPTRADHALADLGGRIDAIVDGGATPVGVESSIVGCLSEPTLLRPGGVPRQAIEDFLSRRLAYRPTSVADAEPAVIAPGMLVSHYAPRTPLRLQATHVDPDEVLLAFGPTVLSGADEALRTLNLSLRGDSIEAAANLFAYLRELDETGGKAIAVMAIPDAGLGEAINDRLLRAAA